MQSLKQIAIRRGPSRRGSDAGFTLLEVSMAMGILSIISLLSFVALRASVESTALARAKEDIQADLRTTMAEIVFEVREAFTERTVNHLLAPDDTEAISVSENRDTLIFQGPELGSGEDMVVSSSPITVTFENEDLPEEGVSGNAELDPGEDLNEDGALTRRIVRIQDGESRVLGSANTISRVEFDLLPNLATAKQERTRLRIRLEASKRYGLKNRLMQAELQTMIDIKN